MTRSFFNGLLGKNEQALAELSWLLENTDLDRGMIYAERAIIHARLGKSQEAKADLTSLAESLDTSYSAYLHAVVSAWLGGDVEGMKRLESFVAEHPQDADLLYNAACAYSLGSQAVRDQDAEKAKAYADRAVQLLQGAVAHGYSDFTSMRSDADLASLHEHSDFVRLLAKNDPRYEYDCIWHDDTSLVSSESHGASPAEHLARCRELMAEGYRPASISAASIDARQPPLTASVWHRPRITEGDKELLAQRQANVAVALFRLGKTERVWPLLKHRADPRTTTYLLHRLGPLGADPKTLIQRLQKEPDASIRQALILCLGELAKDALPSAQRDSLILRLLKEYEDDPDPGVHGAAEWLLRSWGQHEELKQIEGRLRTKNPELTSNRRWYVNSEGHTMVLLEGPVTFRMGDFTGFNDTLHMRRIGRNFAIAAKEVTVGQIQRFLAENQHISLAYDDASVSDVSHPVSWYQATAYCNWLSEREGIPKDQWCYLPNDSGEYAEGMKLASNYLRLGGYRLPTEAEWEYACRAGTLTSRYYGLADGLLGKYAWYRGATRILGAYPVARLKPNLYGLFDMLGNIEEYCGDRWSGYSTGTVVDDVEDPVRVVNDKCIALGSWESSRVSLLSDRTAVYFLNRKERWRWGDDRI